MTLLYSNILPLPCTDKQITIVESFEKQIQNATRVEIAVGYTSNASISELEYLVNKYSIKHICLIIGMYFIEGMPEKAYHQALKLNKKWMEAGIGEIRIVKAFKYHGKLFCFYKNDLPISAILGSANLGVLKLEASNRRQYEISSLITDEKDLKEIATHIEELKKPICSDNITNIKNMPLIRETNTALNGIELVTSVLPSNVAFYKNCKPLVLFSLKLKVPRYQDRHIDDGKHYTKSNINVCYAAPRSKRKARNWYETQLTVGSNIYRMEGYPNKNEPFLVVTDDGYCFKAHTTSDNNKQFSAVGDELIMGRWLKGRLVAAGIVKPINNTALDVERIGMITEEMLEEYGCNSLLFKKTGQKALDENGVALDVWLLSFTSENDKG